MKPIEHAARALCENPSEDPDELIEMMSGGQVPRWQAEVWRVEAVLAAIREPIVSDAKRLEHGTFCGVRDRYPCTCGRDRFISALDHLLSDASEPGG